MPKVFLVELVTESHWDEGRDEYPYSALPSTIIGWEELEEKKYWELIQEVQFINDENIKSGSTRRILVLQQPENQAAFMAETIDEWLTLTREYREKQAQEKASAEKKAAEKKANAKKRKEEKERKKLEELKKKYDKSS